MNAQDFCYWLQGLFELGQPAALSAEQTEMVRRHLALVFENVTAPPALAPAKPATSSADLLREALEEAGRADRGCHATRIIC